LTLLAGRKLLLADDSLAVQKVIDLTFTDEGMQVTTVSDGQDAMEQLEQVAPDVVLADVFMPGVGGYELCVFIKQNERFRKVPVMLLVGSFEPFDEAEARRAGADDVVTKPFQSIRELVKRVGSLVSRREEETATHEYPTLGLARAAAATQQLDQPSPGTNVFVEAARMDDEMTSAEEPRTFAPGADSTDEAGPVATAPGPDTLELQTADTQKLEPIEAESSSSAAESTTSLQEDTIEIEPVMDSRAQAETAELSSTGAPQMNEQMNEQVAQPGATDVLNDSILDLESDLRPSAVDEDFILDLDLEEPIHEATAAYEGYVSEAQTQEETLTVAEADEPLAEEPSYEYETVAATQQWTIIPEPPPSAVAPPMAIEEERSTVAAPEANAGLSAEAIDVIARRVVEHLSDRVVREIAWEVVPELAELLIKQKLEEQR
jgi:CheY-like chemotaxis protein